MSNYIGNQPAFGEFKKLDSLVSLFNGSTTQFNLTYNTIGQSVGDSTQLIVSLNGIVQEPGAAYTLGIGGGSIVFSSAPASTDTCHIVLLGGVGATGTVADGSITATKLASNLRDLLEEEFTANGSATTFTMARTVSYSNQLLVTISGIVQPTSAYSVSGTTLTISPALPNTTDIRVLHVGIPGAFNSSNSIIASMLSSTGGTANQVLAVNSGATGIEFQNASAGTSLTVQEEGSSLGTAATTMNFVGSGVTATGSGATKTITISAGGGSALTVQEEGSSLSTAATTLNFVGSSVTATGSGATKTITIASGGLSDVVSDTSPQLGGTLDANSNTIDMGTNILTDANLGQFITAHGWGNHASGGYQTTSGLNAAIDTHVNQSNPTSGHVLSWNGSDYAWVANTGGGGGGIASVAADTTPQLGGNLDTNGNDILIADFDELKFGTGNDLRIYTEGSGSHIRAATGDMKLRIASGTMRFEGADGSDLMARFIHDGATELYYDNAKKIETTNTGITVTGTVAATALTGNGSGLTSLPAQAFSAITSKPTTISGYGITDAATEFGLPADQSFTVVNSGSSAYTIGGGATGNNATLTLIRGRTYKFAVNASGHPFRINTSNTTGTGAAYVNGTAVINNGAAVGDIYFTVPDTAPDTLYYNCQHHSGMAGTINVSNALRIDKATGNLFVNTTDVDLGFTDGDSGMVLRNDGVFQVARDESGSNNGVLYVNKLNGEGKSIILYNEAVQKGYIGTNGAYLYMGAGDTSLRFHAGADAILPAAETGASRSGAINLGTSGALFKDLYLSGGIQFDARSNKLDDYEEGIFTPVITFGGASAGISYTSGRQSGIYTKVGKLVTYSIHIQLTNRGSSTGALQVTSLPFTSSNNDKYTPGSVFIQQMSSMSTLPIFRVMPNGTVMDCYQMVSSTYSTITHANCASNSGFLISGQYYTDQ